MTESATTSGTTNDNEWQRVVQQVITNDNEWEWVTILANLYFFQITEKLTAKYHKENSLNLEEDPWRRPIDLKAETSP